MQRSSSRTGGSREGGILLRISCGLALLATVVAACVPAEDTVQPVYGSVRFALSMSANHIDLSDGWSFTLERLLAVPKVRLGPDSYGSAAAVCSSIPDSRSDGTLVDYVLGTTLDVNQAVPNGACTEVAIDRLSYADGSSGSLGLDPGVSDADRAAYVGSTQDFLPIAMVVGTASRAGETKRVSLRFAGGSGAASVQNTSFKCTPLQGSVPVTLVAPNERRTLHFALDLASFFPGSPPQFGPIAAADSNGDGVVTSDELGTCLVEELAFQVEAGWQLSPDDGMCQRHGSEAGVPAPPSCHDASDGGSVDGTMLGE